MAQGFLASAVRLIGVELPVPDCPTVSQRQAGLDVKLALAVNPTSRHVAIDTAG